MTSDLSINNINGISKTLGMRDDLSLNDVRFSIKRVEVFELLGTNGYSKTTFIRFMV